jgi:hypothetical protein
MKTDELITMLSTNVEPVDRRKLARSLGITIAFGGAGALVVALLALGARPDFANPGTITFLLVKLVFAVAVFVISSVLLFRLVRPGGERRTHLALAVAPFAGMMLLAALSLANAPSAHWEAMMMGDRWLQCLVSIPIIATLPFAAIVWAVRRFASPTDLVRAGAFAGLVAGGLSAIGYALHCTDDSLPFVALWYGGTIALCTVAGAMLGPRLLRW